MNEKKFRRSPIAIACYVIAALMAAYTVYTFVSTVSYISNYLASYGMTVTDNFADSVSYILSAVIQPLALTIVVFMAGYILEEVRTLNPYYYYSDEEKAARKAAKQEAKEAKKAAKAEAAAIKAAAETVVETSEEATEEVVEAVEEVVEEVAEAVEEN